MNIKKLHNLFLLPLLLGLLSIVMPGCSDDDENALQSEYGYVQFKLYKSASFGAEVASRAAANDQLDSLYDAKKIKVILEYNGTQVSQTLPLHSYNAENAEFGLRSDKLQLTTGTYTIIGYYLYNKLDQQILAGSATEDNTFNVVSGGLEVKPLAIETAKRGMVQFKLEKTGLSRAAGAYLFSTIRLVDVTVMNTFTRETKEFKKLKVKYQEEFLGPDEYEKPEDLQDTDDQYKKIGTAQCDTTVWLPAGNYRVTSYTTYSKNGSVETALETQPVEGKAFVISDNTTNIEANVPIKLSETFEYIKDYLALKEIWEAMDGKNWSFYGDAAAHGTNWNFNKELDMWGDQPGVTLNNQGRVVGLVLAGFGAKGFLPDAIGQLTELEVLNLGSHDEKVGGHMYQESDFKNGLNEQQKKNMRYHYEKHFLKYDPRADMSEMIVNSVNSDPSQKRINKNSRITLKDTQIGVMTSKIEGVSKAIYRLTKLQQFYIGNAPVRYDQIATAFTDADKADSPYKVYSEEFTEDAWSKMTALTDIELYNCPMLTQIPEFYYNLPELQAFNIACNRGISAQQLREDFTRLASEEVGKKIQILYMGYNNLEELPEKDALKNMVKLGLLDLTHNNVKKLHPFGSHVRLSSLYLDNNEITEIPANFCGFTEEVETLGFANNKLTKIPNIFDAKSVFVMGGVNFSNNEIDGVEDPENFKGINAASVTLSYNKFTTFPKELFTSGSPISTLDMSNNLLTEIPEGSIKGKKAYLLGIIDLRFNKLTKLSDDFRSTTLPYLTNMDLSYNCFTEVPPEPLNSANLRAIGIRNQRDAKGNRTLRKWPTGITLCPSLTQLQIGSNDIRKVDETLTPRLYILDIADNPNISIDVTSICPYLEQNLVRLFYDKTQDIRGCDALGIEH